MVQTPSAMVALGSELPHFTLPDVVSGETVSAPRPGTVRGSLVMFICNHCPFVKHVLDELLQIGRDYVPHGIRIYAICSNDNERYPDDAPDKMQALAKQKQFPFPYLLDASQSVARAFDAACTPDFFLYDRDNRLAYRGQLDGSRPGNDVPVTGADLRAALDAVLADRKVEEEQKPSVGCNIKWREAA